ncbi:putative ABC transporter permease protein BAB2_1148 [Candidatus Desulfosporosinus infrequens]|uniref:Putative ABC transporter permease protein BAB2_1148 n=1 Tax=Candidatus Desulfosporosinus infrequens TaxID=2043169 RepID=A0A2U3L058_9FIRM|nr:putative ABC transporter permease protein BAB2_1148 [Candidatus Desulfosporosinus infrequens]
MGGIEIRKSILSFAFLSFGWYVVASLHLVNPMFLPTPFETLKEGARLIAEKKIFIDLIYSFRRIFYGVSLALIMGIPVGLGLGYYEKVYRYLECILDFFRSIPPILTFPLAMLIFGTGEESRIAVIFFGCVSIVILNSAVGVGNSPKLRVNAAKIMGAKWYQIFSRVVIFDALPQIFVGIRVSLSMGVIIGIVTEMLVGDKYGLGSRVVNAQIAYDTPGLFFTIIIVGLIGLTINKLLISLENRVIHWKKVM